MTKKSGALPMVGGGENSVRLEGIQAPPLGRAAQASLEKFGIVGNEDCRKQFYQKGWWRDSTAIDDFEHISRTSPMKTAVVTNFIESARVEETSYSDLAMFVNRISAFLVENGVSVGDVVSVQLPNWWQFNAIALATLRIGAVLNPIIPAHRERDVGFMARLVSSKMCFIPSIYRGFDYPAMMLKVASDLPFLTHTVVVNGEIRHGFVSFEEDVLGYPWEERNKTCLVAIKPDPDQITEILFTSGTTGEPKGVGHTHNTMFARARSIYEVLGLSAEDVVFMPSTLGHSTGFIYGCITPAMLGMKAVYQDIWDPEKALDIIEREKVTWSFTSTTFVIDLIRAQRRSPRKLSSLRYLVSGGATIPPAVVKETKAVLSARLMAVWGMTENGAVTCTRPGEAEFAASSSDGLPSPWMEIRVTDPATGKVLGLDTVGELKVRGASQMLGYVNRPKFNLACTDADGWFSTGDLARIDSQGHLRVTGRIKDLIIRGGENVPVAEIESLLYGHPAISDIAIVAYFDERLGERACAVAVPNVGSELRLEDLTAYLESAGVAKVYWPERLMILDALPYNATGKVQKFRLKQMIADQQSLEEGN